MTDQTDTVEPEEMPAAETDAPEEEAIASEAALDEEVVEAEADEQAGEAEPAAAESLPAGGRRLQAEPNPEIPELRAGDTVNVHLLVREGERERVQEFRGTVIRLRKGGNNANFTVRRTASHGIGVERTFLLRSPLLQKVEIIRRAKVRKAQLYYLRERAGKKARLRERREN